MTEENIKCLPIIDRQATITAKEYVTALTFRQEKDKYAYMFMIRSDIKDKLRFENNMFYSDKRPQGLSDTEVNKIITFENIENINLSLLRVIYSMIFKEYEASNNRLDKSYISIKISDLFKSLGRKPNVGQDRVEGLLRDITQYKNVYGVVINNTGKRLYRNYYEVLSDYKYDEKKKVIHMKMPYLICLIEMMTINDKEPKKKKPTHSFLIKSSIAKVRNRAAIENVNIIVTLIEQAGDNVPHISAKTIVDRNSLLKYRLRQCSKKNRQRIIDKCFMKTWELLRTATLLEDKYINIELPNSEDITSLPKLKNLQKYVYEYRHEGIKKDRS